MGHQAGYLFRKMVNQHSVLWVVFVQCLHGLVLGRRHRARRPWRGGLIVSGNCGRAGRAWERRRACARSRGCSPRTARSAWSLSTPATRSAGTATSPTRASAARGVCRRAAPSCHQPPALALKPPRDVYPDPLAYVSAHTKCFLCLESVHKRLGFKCAPVHRVADM